MTKNLVAQATLVGSDQRGRLKHQRPLVIWLTGLSGAGKSTLANALELALTENERHTYLLDGDNVRLGLCRDLGFSDADREENIRRISEVAKLFIDAGLIVITAFISPFRSDRDLAKSVIGAASFIEVFVDTPLAECERRDPKGLYGKARQGLIKNFTGIDSVYEAPLTPQIRVDTTAEPLTASVERILSFIDARLRS